MTIRNVTKNFAGMEDLQCGVGQIDQVRGTTTYSMGKIDVPYAVNSIAEMQALDVTRFPNARVYSSETAYVEYKYDSADLTGISPTVGSGTWLITSISEEVQELTGAGAIATNTLTTHIVTTAADALTLADGREGQTKFIVMKTDGGTGTLTPASLGNGATITFDDVGDSAHLFFTNSAWHFMGGTATLA